MRKAIDFFMQRQACQQWRKNFRHSMRLESLEARTVLDSTVVFNELMYHPADDSGMPEWIELYNQMSVNVDLTGWGIDGGISYEFPDGTIVPPDNYLVVAANPQELGNQTGFSDSLGPFIGQLSNSGEELRLLNNNDRVMNRVDYRDGGDWPMGPDGSGFSLAKQDETTASASPANWTTSLQSGGTPGGINFTPTAQPTTEILVNEGDQARLLVPANNSLGLSWTESTFDDSEWIGGPTAVGYDVQGENILAYGNLTGAPGTSLFSGSFGHDFDVNSTISITQLGVFDSGADGLSRKLTAEIWSRSGNSGTRLSTMQFTSSDPGTLVDSNRFKSLDTPVVLVPGSYSVVAYGYGFNERAGHEGFAGPGQAFKTLNDGGGLLSFVGTSRLGTTTGSFPAILESGNVNYYSAGTFQFVNGAAGSVLPTDIETEMHLVNTSAYVRMPFALASLAELQTLTLDLQYNDGLVAYINGQEIARRNAPAELNSSSTATASVVGVVHELVDVTAHLSALQTGTNVLAIHGLNGTVDDNQFYILPKLSAVRGIPEESRLAINEVSAGGSDSFFIEIQNDSTTSKRMQGHIIASSSGQEYVFPNQTIVAGGYLSVTTAELGFIPGVGERLFLFTPGRFQLSDARQVTGRLRGRSPAYDGRWLYPDTATPEDHNSFSFYDDIVINEIMYHPYGEVTSTLVDVAPMTVPLTTSLVAAGTDATVLIPASDSLGTSWQLPGYDDSAWTSGSAAIGFNASSTHGIIAYGNLTGANGSFSGNNTFGHDFVVQSTIAVTHLGVFDSGADGLLRTLTAELWSRNENSGTKLTELEFTTSDPGNLVDSNRLKPLATPLVLPPGDYSMVAHGYGWGEPVGHQGFGGPGASFKALDDGHGSISFVGTSRLGTQPGVFPNIVDSGAVNYYSAGTFQFDAVSAIGPLVHTDVESVMHGVNSSAYVRVEFTATPLDDENTTLTLDMKYDDGFVAYLNGTEVARRNAPTSIEWNSSSITSAEVTSVFETMDVTAHIEEINTGLNVLAIQGLNASSTDDDFLLLPELKVTTTEPPVEDWLELYNRGSSTIDLSNWQLQDGVSYTFPMGTTLSSGSYLVVARDADRLRALVPGITVLGDFTGRLNNQQDRVTLVDQHGNLADTVQYYESKPWPKAADGGGSSLELRDPRADNVHVGAWSASDESSRTAWQTYSYRDIPDGGSNRLYLGLLDSGTVLLDDIRVIRDPDGDGTQLLTNGNFSSGLAGWSFEGTHYAEVVSDPENPGNPVLQLTASSHMTDNHNRLRGSMSRSSQSVEHEISFRARWVSETNLLHTYLVEVPAGHLVGANHSGQRLAATTRLELPTVNGTPGKQNSTFLSNAGPTLYDMIHSPTVPAINEPTVISVGVEDPDGVGVVNLRWNVNGGAFQTTSMAPTAGDIYTTTLPGQTGGARIQFYVTATDELGATSIFPAAGINSRALYTVEDGQAQLGNLHNVRIILTGNDINTLLSSTNAHSNQRRGATLIVNESEVFYDVGVRLSGGASRTSGLVGFNIRLNADNLFRGVHDTITVDRNNLNESFTRQIYLRTTGIPKFYNDMIRYIWPGGSHTGFAQLRMARYDDVYLDSQFTDGSAGMLFEKEQTRVKIEDRGSDKETYRWTFLIKNNRWRDDYSRMIDMSQAFSLTGQALDNATDEIMDIDQWMRVFASARLFGNRDFHSQPLASDPNESERHNFLVYVRPVDNKVLALPWDIDESFQVPLNSSLIGNTNLANVIELPGNIRRLYGHMHDLIEMAFNSSVMTPIRNHLATIFPGVNYASAQSYIQQRTAYVMTQLPAEIPFEVTTNGGTDFTVDTPAVSLQGNAWYRIKDIFLEGRSEPLEMTWSDEDTWQTDIVLAAGANVLNFQGYDYQGNLIASDSITVASTSGAPLQQTLRVSELYYNPYDALPQFGELEVDNDQFEFIELVNTGAQAIDLEGAQLVKTDVAGDRQGVDFIFAAQSLSPNESIVVVRNSSAFQSRFGNGPRLALGEDGLGGNWGEYDGGLDNGGERITLLDATGVVIQQFDYDDSADWPGRADGNGSSLEVVDTAGDYSDPDNWRSSIDFGGSPGAIGSTPATDVLISEVLAHTDPPLKDTIELVNTTNTDIDVSGWYLSDSSRNFFKFSLPPVTTLPANGYLVFDEDDFNPGVGTQPTDFSLSSFGDDIWLWSVDAGGRPDKLIDHVEFSATLTDVSIGRLPTTDASSDLVPLNAASFGESNMAHRPGELIISEVHYNPPGVDAGLEFLELHNASFSSIDLAQWRLDRAVDFVLPSQTLAAGGSVVLVDFDPVVEVDKDTAFRAAYGISDMAVLLGPWQAGDVLDNGGEKVDLQRKNDELELEANQFTYILIDQVVYDDVAPWPIVPDAGGHSLSRTSPTVYGNESANWAATVPNPGSFGTSIPGDFNHDQVVDATDIDLLLDEVDAGTHDQAFDLTGESQVTRLDVDYLVQDILGTSYGDTDLDGDVDTSDLTLAIMNFTGAEGAGKGWAVGDTDGDGDVDTSDLTKAIINFSGAAAYRFVYVGEPGEDDRLNNGRSAIAFHNMADVMIRKSKVRRR